MKYLCPRDFRRGEMEEYMTEEKDTYIESVADYLNTLPQNQEFFDTLLDKLTLFRGQGNKEWDLMPSVMRNRDEVVN